MHSPVVVECGKGELNDIKVIGWSGRFSFGLTPVSIHINCERIQKTFFFENSYTVVYTMFSYRKNLSGLCSHVSLMGSYHPSNFCNIQIGAWSTPDEKDSRGNIAHFASPPDLYCPSTLFHPSWSCTNPHLLIKSFCINKNIILSKRQHFI